MLAAGAFTFVFAARIGNALHAMTALANGDTSRQIAVQARRDEIGDMASNQVLASAQMPSRESHTLSAEVAKFLETVHAA